MTLLEFLRGIPNFQEFSRKSKILLLAYYLRRYKGMVEFSAADMETECRGLLKPPSDLRTQLRLLAKGKNSLLAKGSAKDIFSLNMPGLDEVESYLAGTGPAPAVVDAMIADALTYLKKTVAKLSDDNQRKFMAEAISCLAVDAPRATIVMAWAGTCDHLYDYILKHKLNEFNNALARRTDRYARLTIATKDDFADMKESVVIEVARSAGVITNDVRKVLDEKLGIRNTCAHPSSVEVHRSKVVSVIEDLIDNVILKHPI
ncbi:MAG: hypothetical protein GXY19_00565 [Phycisphaerae bacterium]|nr:hypothetical protein [Phycisphaerae bacterium]